MTDDSTRRLRPKKAGKDGDGTLFPGPDDDVDRAGDTSLVEEVLAGLPGYRLERKLGQGAMGVVYLAHQLSMDRPVAVKALLPFYAQDEDARERFLRETRLLARCAHPSIVAGYDAGCARGVYYYVMEYVDGPSLSRTIETEGPLPHGRVLAIVRDMAGALEHAHSLGLLHRDIKPDNVLLDPSGQAKVADLGLAKIVASEAREPGVTRAGWVLGTLAYMPPEQLAAEPDLDIRTDLYALGISWFEMLTGRVPYPMTGPEHFSEDKILGRLPTEHLRRVGAGDDVIAMIRRLCAPARGDRYPDPTALLRDLEHLERGEPVGGGVAAEEGEPPIVVVEDDPSTALMVAGLLEREGHRVRVLVDGTEALAAIRDTAPPRLVLLDVELPGSDGFEIMERLRRSPTWRSVPVIMLTGRSAEEDIVSALDAGANDYVAKPPRPAELLARVRRQLSEH